MKIDKSPTVVSLGKTESDKSVAGTRTAPVAPSAAPAGQSTLTHLTPTPGNTSQDIDQARVNDLRQAILEGRLEMNTDKIADGLLASVRDMLGDKNS